jgi:hypothetical protein
VINQDAQHARQFHDSQHDPLLAEIDTLELELELSRVAEATGNGHARISARADYLRAQAAHQRAVTAWSVASGPHQLNAARDALDECRSALEATRTSPRH